MDMQAHGYTVVVLPQGRSIPRVIKPREWWGNLLGIYPIKDTKLLL
jgi:hypothetical protein